MKRFVYLGVLALSAGLLATPALAQRGQGEKGRFTLHGEVRVRGEFQSNVMDFFDETATGGPNDDDFDLFPYRVRIAAHGQFSRNVSGHVEIQNSSFFGNSPLGPFQSPSDPFLQSFRGSFGTQETILYQGYIDVKNVGDSAASFRIGRQEHTLANELMLGDLDFYNGISFDGFRANFDFAQWDLDAFYYVILEGSALDSTLSGATIGADNDVAFTGLDADFTFGDHGTHIRPYILFLDDGGSGITTGIGRPAMQVYTFGGQWGREVNSVEDVDDSPLDWSAEAAIQSGDFDTTSILGPMVQDVSGFIVEGWIGFNWNHGHHSRSRVHAGILIASGDDDPTDGDYDAFIPMFPDTHSRNRLGNLDLFGEPFSTAFGGGIPNNTPVVIGPAGPGNLSNLSNITDVSFGYEVWGEDETHYLLVSLHNFTLSEEACLGSVLPGCAGGIREDSIGNELDIQYNYNYNENLSFELGFSQLFSGDLLDNLVQVAPGGVPAPPAGVVTASADDPMRIWGQARLRW